MVDVVEADIAAEPSKHCREIVVRTSFESGIEEIPFRMPRPVRTNILVLDVEKPNSETSGDPDGWQKDKNEWHDTHGVTESGDNKSECNIRPVDALLFPRP